MKTQQLFISDMIPLGERNTNDHMRMIASKIEKPIQELFGTEVAVQWRNIPDRNLNPLGEVGFFRIIK